MSPCSVDKYWLENEKQEVLGCCNVRKFYCHAFERGYLTHNLSDDVLINPRLPMYCSASRILWHRILWQITYCDSFCLQLWIRKWVLNLCIVWQQVIVRLLPFPNSVTISGKNCIIFCEFCLTICITCFPADIGATEVPAGIERVAVVEQEEGEDHSILDLSSLQPFSKLCHRLSPNLDFSTREIR